MRCPLCGGKHLTSLGFLRCLKGVADGAVPEAAKHAEVEWLPARKEHPKASEEEE